MLELELKYGTSSGDGLYNIFSFSVIFFPPLISNQSIR